MMTANNEYRFCLPREAGPRQTILRKGKASSLRMIAAVLFAGFFIAGCSMEDAASPATGSENQMTASGDQAAVHPQHAQCLVCKYNADLACLDLTVDKNTPSYVYNGKTYYFCSEDCKKQFAQDPVRYLPVAR